MKSLNHKDVGFNYEQSFVFVRIVRDIIAFLRSSLSLP